MKRPKPAFVSPEFQRLFDAFCKEIRLQQRDAVQINEIEPVLEFLAYFESQGRFRIRDIIYGDIKAYMNYLIARPNKRRGGTLASGTINTHVRSLNKFNDFLLLLKATDECWGLTWVRSADAQERTSATLDEIALLYAACQTHQERAVLSLGYGCGLRRSEIVALNTEDVFLREGFLVVKAGKYNKRREVILSDAVIGYLGAYLTEERHTYLRKEKQLERAFLVGARGARINGQLMYLALKKLVQRTENAALIEKGIGLHSLRHSIAEHLLDQGADLEFVQEFLGHVLPDTTIIYARKRKKQMDLLKKFA